MLFCLFVFIVPSVFALVKREKSHKPKGGRNLTIKELRERRGYTQDALARALELDRSTVSKWEVGKARPCKKLIPKLCTLLGCTAEELENGKEA